MDTVIQNLQSDIESLRQSVTALSLSGSTAKQIDEQAIFERIADIEKQVQHLASGKSMAVTDAIGTVQAAADTQVNSGLRSIAKQTADLICDVEDGIRTDFKRAQRETQNQVADATSAMMKMALLAEIQGETAARHITNWLAQKV